MSDERYPEAELIRNRTSTLLFGGSADDRRAWAEEAQQNLQVGQPLHEATTADQLNGALVAQNGVVYVPNVVALGLAGQAEIVRCLLEREERPKIVMAVPANPDSLCDQGLLRPDLSYRLRSAHVNLSDDDTRIAVRKRQSRRPSASAHGREVVAKSASRRRS